MRKLMVSTFVSLDGVMQAPGGPDEDPRGGFTLGGWTVPYFDEALGAEMDDIFAQPFDLLLGRRTYDIFAAHWPHVPLEPGQPGYDPGSVDIARKFNACAKHVATHRPESLAWQNSHALGPDVAAAVRVLKGQDGPTLLVQGSSELLQILFAHGLVDEARLLVMPVVLGKGLRLFGGGALPAAFHLTHSFATPAGVLVARYRLAGEVQTGSFALEVPTEAEVERRQALGG
ncbi:dihydrofolate reductase family protein [Aerophototrophica crusticola]|uniref:Dihydrofolate reductase family protein n=1 Tax=Aerophototrophica crusticola TaxID=1709002 RepID=A0A858R304_9PROT|nr:dihydrofolate reductase family protein [Rhodospirillaceae bacterium B3]